MRASEGFIRLNPLGFFLMLTHGSAGNTPVQSDEGLRHQAWHYGVELLTEMAAAQTV